MIAFLSTLGPATFKEETGRSGSATLASSQWLQILSVDLYSVLFRVPCAMMKDFILAKTAKNALRCPGI
jgi:hypothetical protein